LPPLTFEPGGDPEGPLGDAFGLLGPEGEDPLGFSMGVGHGQGTYVTGAQTSMAAGGGLEPLLQIAGLPPLDLAFESKEVPLDPVALGPGEAPLEPRGDALDNPETGLLPFDPPEGAVPFGPPEGTAPLDDPPSTGFPPV